MKEPAACQSLQELRQAIDQIDRDVIALLGRRFQYVQAAAPFKTSASEVQAAERQRTMLAQRRTWATEEGLSPDVIEKIYQELIRYFVAEELNRWQNDASAPDAQ